MQQVNVTLSPPNIDHETRLAEVVLVTIKTYDYKDDMKFYCSPEMIKEALSAHIEKNFPDKAIASYI